MAHTVLVWVIFAAEGKIVYVLKKVRVFLKICALQFSMKPYKHITFPAVCKAIVGD